MNIKKVLVANRGEIAIRVFRACSEINIKTVGIYTYEDRYSLHRYKSDESYQIGNNDQPIKPYLDIHGIIKIAKEKNVDAIHPGYGFLSENAEFARKCKENKIIFVGPEANILEILGDKIKAKKVALKNNIPIIESSKKKLSSLSIAIEEAKTIGLPVMLKAASGGGGRGMRVIRTQVELEKSFSESKREALNAFGDDTVFLEKYVENPKHIEVQIVADNHGDLVHLFERDCSVQRRYQKVVEIAPSYGISDEIRNQIFTYATKLTKAVNYNNIGTVEFLVDQDKNIFFIEVNPRIQVEHTVTEMITNIDLVKTQLFVAGGYKLSDRQIKIYGQDSINLSGFAIQCRITTEDPANDFKPDYGTITTYRSASGFGIRLDAGSLYQGVRVSPFFDSMLVKVSAHSRTLDGSIRKMIRTLCEFRIRGVHTNISFLLNLLRHPALQVGKVTVNFIASTPELFQFKLSRDRASKIVKYLANITINGNPDIKEFSTNKVFNNPVIPPYDIYAKHPKGSKDLLTELGPEKFSEWLKSEKKIHFTDTTMRDAHQSLLATRMRTLDMLKVAEGYSKNNPEIFSLEVWGGATFDVCMRFLNENPWGRLALLRKAMPNILLQMLLRGSNGVGYAAYPDNLIESFVEKSWETGVDIFRIFDSLNWMQSIGPAIEYVRKRTNGLAEGAISYTGDLLDPKNTKYTLKYYIQLAKDIENAGAHILAIKDMAGLLKPYAATELILALKSETNLPIHLHTHDTSSIQAATYLKAIEAGVDVVDVALGGLSGLTSQPNFNSIIEMLKYNDRNNPMNSDLLNQYSNYWETVRDYYYPFESGLKAGTGEIYNHEIPGGQYSNLKPQAQSLGLGDRFHEITKMYSDVNHLFGDLIKVTPSSKVVGDMALYLVSNNLTIKDVLEKGDTISFPQSVISFFKGDLGQPLGGFSKKLQKIILKNEKAFTNRPSAHLQPVNFKKEFEDFKIKYQKDRPIELDFTEFLSFKLYPKVWDDTHKHYLEYGNITRIPTENFFYGLKEGEEIMIQLDEGKVIDIELLSINKPNSDGYRTVFFKVNGQYRNIQILDKSLNIVKHENEKADTNNESHIGAPLQGRLSEIFVKKGQKVKKNEALFIIEAMKMETTITASRNLEISNIKLKAGEMVNADDLVVIVK